MGKQARKKRIKKEHEDALSLKDSPEVQVGLSFKYLLFSLFIIISLGILIYSNTLNAPFQWDEILFIEKSPIIKDFQFFLEPSKADELDDKYHKFKSRYIGFFTFFLNYSLHRLNVTGYHIVNISIHLINAVLVFFLVLMIFKSPFLEKSDLRENSVHIAFLTSLFFVSHPVQTEAITYIWQRIASLTALFYLCAVVFYIKGRLTVNRTKRNIFFVFALLSTVLAMKTKENSFTIPFIIILYEMLFFSGSLKKRLVRFIPFMMTLLIIPLTFIHINNASDGIMKSLNSATADYTGMSRWDYFFTQLRVILTYIRLLFFPVNQNLDYDYPIYTTFFNPEVIFGFLCIVSLLGLSVFLVIRSRTGNPDLRIIAFGLFWFFITISVESSLIPLHTIIDEYRLYLPSSGFFLAFVTGAFLITKKIKDPKIIYKLMIVLILMIAIFSYMAYKRNSLWNSTISLWEDVVSKSPSKARSHFKLGNEYLKAGLLDNAIQQYNISLQLKAYKADEVHNNLGSAYLLNWHRKSVPESTKKHFIDTAIEHCNIALQLNPALSEAHINLAHAYLLKGMLDISIKHSLDSLKLKQNDARVYNNLADAYIAKGLYSVAIEHYITALRLDPVNANIHLSLGVAYLKNNQKQKALKEFETSLSLNPKLDYARNYINKLSQEYQKGKF